MSSSAPLITPRLESVVDPHLDTVLADARADH
jgi:hypothetical protein